MIPSEDDYYRRLWQNTTSKECCDAGGAGADNSSPHWTPDVLRGSAASSPEILYGMVDAQPIAGLIGSFVEDTDIVVYARLMGAGQLGHQ